MIRILHLVNGMNCGGTENMIMSLYRNIDRDKIQFDFLVNSKEKCFFDDEIKKLGGKIFYIPRWKGTNTADYLKKFNLLLDEHPEYKIIHGHIASCSLMYLSVAKKRGLFAISHSHNVKGAGKSLSELVFKLSTLPQRYMSDSFFACSDIAGKVRFGKRAVKSDKFFILKNVIDLKRYERDEEKASKLKEKYGISDKFVVGHIGRFVEAKNHSFLLKVFCEVTKIIPDSVLVLAGEGELFEKIKAEAKELGIYDKVIFAGVLSDVNSVINIMDAFVFPSLHEGFGIVAIEAQSHGIPCFINDALSDELYINENVYGLSLKNSPAKWAEAICKNKECIPCDKAKSNIREKGYDIKATADFLENYYYGVI